MDEKYRPDAGRDTRATPPAAGPAEAAAIPAETAAAIPAETAPAIPAAVPSLLDRMFGRDEITAVRHQMIDLLGGCGVGGDRLQGFVLAVNEIVTNVVLHAGGNGRLVLGLRGRSVWCTVTDSGPGIPDRFLRRPDTPRADELGGRGIWLAHQLCDEVTIATGPIGTTVGLRIALPGGLCVNGQVSRVS